MRIRDEPIATEIDAVTAWRGWSLVEEEGQVRLSSLTRAESWIPRAPHAASCSKGRRPTPQRRCRCGVYATTTPEALGGLRSLPGGVVGEVSLWGRVIEHGTGYRAELGYPARLGLVCAGCQAEGIGRRADVVQRLDSPGRIRLLPWCEEHAPAAGHVAARDVESVLLAEYAVDPVSDEMIERIRPDGTRRPERSPRRRAFIAAIAAAAIALGAFAAVALSRPAPPPAGAGTEHDLRFVGAGSDIGEPVTTTPNLLTNYPPIRIVTNTTAAAPICGHAAGGDARVVDCHADSVNAYVFSTAPIGTPRLESCTEHADATTTQGHLTLCWRLLANVP